MGLHEGGNAFKGGRPYFALVIVRAQARICHRRKETLQPAGVPDHRRFEIGAEVHLDLGVIVRFPHSGRKHVQQEFRAVLVAGVRRIGDQGVFWNMQRFIGG